ncbi:AAA family ATPase [Oerskovia sp. NPDC057915]|uniref:AAA family ATPase n=1 Tax=Oerskovia sp. NPDC057915 TaxID=3346280 RepID=UPI0036D89FD5
MIETLAIEGYRSLRHLVLPLGRLTVVTGANGVGKSSLYRSLRLLAECALGGAVGALAREGGLPSTLWAGPEVVGRSVREGVHPVQGTVRRGPVALRLGFASGPDPLPDGAAPAGAPLTGAYGYAIDLGLPQDGGASFGLDPEIKTEVVWSGPVLRPATLVADRHGPSVRLRDEDGAWRSSGRRLRSFDSMLSEVVDPVGAPELVLVRERLRSWRFYDQFRTDALAPARASHVGTRTPVLAHDGADLAAALETIRELGLADDLDAAVEDAFPGSSVRVRVTDDGRFSLELRQHGLLRPLGSAELSDGTLRYLLWVAALLTPRPPELLVLNEPETSLHPDLLPALGALIAGAARRTQVVVVTHSRALVRAMEDAARGSRVASPGLVHVELVKELGETTVEGREGLLDEPQWHWPKR